MSIDALKLANEFEAAGLPHEQAAKMAAAIRDSLGAGHLVTKQDLSELESRLQASISALEARLIRWFATALLVQGGVIVGLIKLLP